MCRRRRRVKMLYVPKCIIIYPAIVVEKKIELTFGFFSLQQGGRNLIFNVGTVGQKI